MGSIVYNGISSTDAGFIVSGGGAYNAPERAVNVIDIPGRSGALIEDLGRWNNIQVDYVASILDITKRDIMADMLLSGAGKYCRLTDSYHTDEYRMARFIAPLNLEMWPRLKGADMVLSFDCQPQRWLTSGEVYTAFTGEGGTLINPTAYEAKPLLQIQTSSDLGNDDATVTINGSTFTFRRFQSGYISFMVDCENYNCYSLGNLNWNHRLSGDFPTLAPGENEIAIETNNITYVRVFPRWYRL